jgi:alpha-mannosidase
MIIGYFTSRPALKKYVRAASAYLNAARQFEVFYKRSGTETWPLEEANGLAQHHDAVSGTSKVTFSIQIFVSLSKLL